MTLGIHVERISLNLFDLCLLDPRHRAIAAFLEMREDGLLLLRRKLGAKLIVDQWQFTPEAEIRFVVVFDVGRARDRTLFPIRRKVPGTGLEQELFGFGEVLLIASDDPDERRRFGNAGDATTDILNVPPLVRLVGIAILGIGVAVSHRFDRKRECQIILVEVSLDFRERLCAIARGAIGAEVFLAAFDDHGTRRLRRDMCGDIGCLLSHCGKASDQATPHHHSAPAQASDEDKCDHMKRFALS